MKGLTGGVKQITSLMRFLHYALLRTRLFIGFAPLSGNISCIWKSLWINLYILPLRSILSQTFGFKFHLILWFCSNFAWFKVRYFSLCRWLTIFIKLCHCTITCTCIDFSEVDIRICYITDENPVTWMVKFTYTDLYVYLKTGSSVSTGQYINFQSLIFLTHFDIGLLCS